MTLDEVKSYIAAATPFDADWNNFYRCENCHCDDCEKQRALRDAGWYFAPGGMALPPGWTWGAA